MWGYFSKSKPVFNDIKRHNTFTKCFLKAQHDNNNNRKQKFLENTTSNQIKSLNIKYMNSEKCN